MVRPVISPARPSKARSQEKPLRTMTAPIIVCCALAVLFWVGVVVVVLVLDEFQHSAPVLLVTILVVGSLVVCVLRVLSR